MGGILKTKDCKEGSVESSLFTAINALALRARTMRLFRNIGGESETVALAVLDAGSGC